MPQLALDQRQRDPLAQQLDSVSMAELVRGYAPADAGRECEVAQLNACGAVRPRPAAGWTVDHAEQHPDRELHSVSQPWLDRRPRPGIHPDLAPAIVLAVPDQNRAAALVKIGLGQRQRLLDP